MGRWSQRQQVEVVDDGDRLRAFHSGRIFARRRSAIVVFVILLACAAVAVAAGAWAGAAGPFLWIFGLALWDRATATRRGWRTNGTLRLRPWSEADAVLRPGRWDVDVQLRLLIGGERGTGIPAEYVDRVVELSGLPLIDRATHPVRTSASRQRRERSIAERGREVQEDLARLRDDD